MDNSQILVNSVTEEAIYKKDDLANINAELRLDSMYPCLQKFYFGIIHGWFLQLRGRASPLCVVADDSIFLTVAVAHLSESAHIISMLPRLRNGGYMYLKAVAYSNGFSMHRVKVLGKSSAGLTIADTNHKQVKVTFSLECIFSLSFHEIFSFINSAICGI